MVARGYYINRIFGLICALITITICAFQIYVLMRKRKSVRSDKTEIKHYLHCATFICPVTICINFIDPFGVFGFIPFFAQNLLLNAFGTRWIMIGVCIIIYGHFAAHYKALKKQIPKFFSYFFIITMSINFIGGLTATIAQETKPELYLIGTIIMLLWLASLLLIDLYGFYLVRNLVIEAVTCRKQFDRQKISPSHSMATIQSNSQIILGNMPTTPNSQRIPPSSPVDSQPLENSPTNQIFYQKITQQDHSHQSQKKTPSTNYQDFLSRIRRFHITIGILVGFYLCYVIYGLSRADNANSRFASPDPNKFVIGAPSTYMPYTYLSICHFLIWWAWIPISWKDLVLGKIILNLSKSSEDKRRAKPLVVSFHQENNSEEGGGGVNLKKCQSIESQLNTHDNTVPTTPLVTATTTPTTRVQESISISGEMMEMVKTTDTSGSNQDLLLSPIRDENEIISSSSHEIVLVKITENGEIYPQ